MTVLLFGATGNAGGAVLKACLADPGVAEVRAIARRPPAPGSHSKLRLVVHQNFNDYSAIRETFRGVEPLIFANIPAFLWLGFVGLWVARAARHPATSLNAIGS